MKSSGVAAGLFLAVLISGAAVADPVCYSRERTNFRVGFDLGQPKLEPGWTLDKGGPFKLDYVIGMASDIGPYMGLSVDVLSFAFSGHGLSGVDGKTTVVSFAVGSESYGPAEVYSEFGLYGFNTPAARPLLQHLRPDATGTLEVIFSTDTGLKMAAVALPLKEMMAGLQSCAPQ